jgi:molybdopterin-guanine dinucleotide biosynthesis protein A
VTERGTIPAAGIVLCGGRSSRMGRPKAWLPWCGRPVVVHVVDQLRRATDEVVVVCSADLELPPLPVPVVRDRDPGLGPLAGIREGLQHTRAERSYVTSTDAPFLTPEFVRAMLAFEGAAAPEVDGRVQTLAAVYPRAALPLAEKLIADARLRPLFLLEELGYRKLRPDELPGIDAIRGFNTPGEYLAAVRAVDANACATVELLGRARRATGRELVEVPVGTLAEVLGRLDTGLDLVHGDRVAAPFLVSLGGRDLVRDARLPIGPGERVIVLDAQAGG